MIAARASFSAAQLGAAIEAKDRNFPNKSDGLTGRQRLRRIFFRSGVKRTVFDRRRIASDLSRSALRIRAISGLMHCRPSHRQAIGDERCQVDGSGLRLGRQESCGLSHAQS
jgi:hypothetical protein